jgi:TonB family protein
MPPSTVRSVSSFLFLSILIMGAVPIRRANAQDSSSRARKVVRKTMPVYPPLARQINLAGTVKVTAIVEPDGKVKTVEPVGGSPILIEAAKEAIVQWKFAPASAESREVIELHFNP